MKCPPLPRLAAAFILAALLPAGSACSRREHAAKSARKKTGEISSVHVEKRSDGLIYAEGGQEPYTGEVATFSGDITRQSVETYLDGKPHGFWLRYWSDGKVKRWQQWVHGSMVHQRQWYEDGALKEDMQARDGLACGQVRLYWPGGRLRRMAFVEEDLRPHGHVLEYNEDGTVLVDAIFEHGEFVSGLRREDSLAPPATAQAH